MDAGQELFTFTISFGKAFPLPRANENIRATKTIGRTGGWKFEKFGVGVSRPVPPTLRTLCEGRSNFSLRKSSLRYLSVAPKVSAPA
jgi:hypothetical protein